MGSTLAKTIDAVRARAWEVVEGVLRARGMPYSIEGKNAVWSRRTEAKPSCHTQITPAQGREAGFTHDFGDNWSGDCFKVIEELEGKVRVP